MFYKPFIKQLYRFMNISYIMSIQIMWIDELHNVYEPSVTIIDTVILQ